MYYGVGPEIPLCMPDSVLTQLVKDELEKEWQKNRASERSELYSLDTPKIYTLNSLTKAHLWSVKAGSRSVYIRHGENIAYMPKGSVIRIDIYHHQTQMFIQIPRACCTTVSIVEIPV